MNKPGMIRLEDAHFSNLIGAVQRTASLPGGAIRDLPNGGVVDGLIGVTTFASAIADAQKEFRMGRPRQSLERIRQLESNFSGISGRWNGMVQSYIAGARQGRQSISLGRLNELKQAESRMQQLVGPVNKAFRDLVSALQYEVSMEGRDFETSNGSDPSDGDSEDPTATIKLPSGFEERFECGQQLELRRGKDKRTTVVPQLERRSHYLISEDEGQRVIQITSIEQKSLDAIDAADGTRVVIGGSDLLGLIGNGMWKLEPKQ